MEEQKFDPDAIDPNLMGNGIPKYLQQAPWYYPKEGTEHLKQPKYAQPVETSVYEKLHQKRTGEKRLVKWKPGCCKNCGSDQHTEFECTERPRKKNARAMGESIVEKENIPIRKVMGYDAKRDHDVDYTPARWRLDTKSRYRYLEQVRADAKPVEDNEPEIIETFGTRSSRNRTDVAAYIKAIDSKTPAFIDDGSEESRFIQPHIDEEKDPKKAQKMAWEMDAETRRRQTEEKENQAIIRAHAREFQERKAMIERGGKQEIILSEEIPKSKRYAELEDNFVNGHTAVWGSFYCAGEWGYACCKQTDRNSICTASHE